MKNNISIIVFASITFFIFVILSSYLNTSQYSTNTTQYSTNTTYVKDLYIQTLELKYNASKNNLVDSIDIYISQVAPHSNMNALTFVNECEKHDIDIFFVLSQCQLESNFATTGLGAKTNSAFNIKAYDGKGDKYMNKYKHPDLSIEPYLKILKHSYLDDEKTELHLLENYTNKSGNRYASDEQYEQKLLCIYNKISKRLNDTYQIYQKYKMLTSN